MLMHICIRTYICTHTWLHLSTRCFAALGDVSKVRYLQEINDLADRVEMETVSS